MRLRVRRLAALAGVVLALTQLAADTPGASVRSWQLELFNETLLLDNGTSFGFGNERARDRIPDGWWTVPTQGGVLARSAEAEDGGVAVRLVAPAGVDSKLYSARIPVRAGRAVTLSTRVRARPGLQHGGTLSLRFIGDKGHLGTLKRRVPLTEGGWQDLSLTANAPHGAGAVVLEWSFFHDGGGPGGWIELEPLRLTASRVETDPTAPALRRILLVTLGSTRADHADGYGRDTTAVLDRLAAEGTLFTNHRSVHARTVPSLAALWTGWLPAQTDLDLWGAQAPATAATRLAGAGYATGAFLAHNRLGATRGFTRGVHHPWQLDSRATASQVNAVGLPWLASHADQAVFLWAHYNDGERPFTPPAPYDTRFTDDALWRKDTLQLRRGSEVHEGRPLIPEPVYEPGRLARRHYVARYDGELASADHALGSLVTLLEELALAQDTLVVVTADHGISLTEHGRYFSTGSVYDHDLRVPLVLWSPGRVPAGQRIDVATDHQDVLPTLLDFAGLPGGDLPGRSLRPLLDGPEGAAAWSPRVHVATTGTGEHTRHAVWGTGSWKVVTDAGWKPLALYDLDTDPGELRDVLWRRPGVARTLADQGAAALESRLR